MKIKISFFLSFFLSLCVLNIFGQSITFTTGKTLGSEISFGLRASANNTLIQVDFGNGVKVDKTVGTSYTSISGTLIGSQTIKIYGSTITLFDCSAQLTSLDVSAATSLISLSASSNILTSLNVSQNTALQSIDVRYCNLTALDVSKNTALTFLVCLYNKISSLDVSKNTELVTLNCCENLLTSIDVSNNPKLSSLDIQGNQIEEIDLSKNVALKSMMCQDNLLTSIDLSACPLFYDLVCYNNKLTSVNITKNPKITRFLCDNNKLTSIDISKNTLVTSINLNWNQLSSLDLSANTLVQELYCAYNNLSSLNITNNTKLEYLNFSGNNFTFTSLPSKTANIRSYSYTPQKAFQIQKNIQLGNQLDLSSLLISNGNTTNYTWKTKGGSTLIAGVDYTLTDGKTIFLTNQSDSIFCEMTNATWPDFTGYYVYKTTNVKIDSETLVKTLTNTEVKISAKGLLLQVEALKNGRIMIYNMTGQKIIEQAIYTGTTQYNIPQTGIYLVKLINEDEILAKKIMIK